MNQIIYSGLDNKALRIDENNIKQHGTKEH